MKMTLYDSKGNAIKLEDRHHVATGGEGSVYLRDGNAYKVYTDPALALKKQIDKKWKLLASIGEKSIVAPKDQLVDDKYQFKGLIFPEVSGTTLCETFSNAWWNRTGFDMKKCSETVANMRSTVAAAHVHKAIIVDGNEMNWLLDGTQPYLLDTDSWQIGGFPATAIMPSIRDWHTNGFDEGSDWYSWAIVTFQLWTGIHPFKGNHPIHGKGWEDRMKLHASVFDDNVRMPAAVREFSNIPPALLKWYQSMFSSGVRQEPPKVFDAVSSTVKKTISNVKSLKLSLLASSQGKVIAVINGFVIYKKGEVFTVYDVIFNRYIKIENTVVEQMLNNKAALVRTDEGIVSCAIGDNQHIDLINLQTGQTGSVMSKANTLWQTRNKVFFMESDGEVIQELQVYHMGTGLLGKLTNWSVLVKSSKFYRQLIIQQLFGKTIIGLIKDQGMIMLPAWDLNDYHIINGSYVDKDNIWVLAKEKTTGEDYIIRLKEEINKVAIQEKWQATTPVLNMGATTAGVGMVQIDDQLCIHKGDKQNWLNQETIAGTILTGLPFMAMVDDEGVIFKIEKH